jgi:hypothetical protein
MRRITASLQSGIIFKASLFFVMHNFALLSAGSNDVCLME